MKVLCFRPRSVVRRRIEVCFGHFLLSPSGTGSARERGGFLPQGGGKLSFFVVVGLCSRRPLPAHRLLRAHRRTTAAGAGALVIRPLPGPGHLGEACFLENSTPPPHLPGRASPGCVGEWGPPSPLRKWRLQGRREGREREKKPGRLWPGARNIGSRRGLGGGGRPSPPPQGLR